tara:strand:+ start:1065 stop:1640 length:576 start_codon:yes stop_codon:yes gene_type:complete
MDRRKALKNIGSGIGVITVTPSVVSFFQSCQAEISYTPAFVSQEDFEILSSLMELIIPKTEIPGAKELKLPEFIDAYADAVWSNENKAIFLKGWSDFKAGAIEASEKEKASQLTIDNWDAELVKYLRSEKTHYDQENGALEFAKELRNLTVNAFKVNEFVGKNVLAYSPVPGYFDGCVDLMETTAGKAWSL